MFPGSRVDRPAEPKPSGWVKTNIFPFEIINLLNYISPSTLPSLIKEKGTGLPRNICILSLRIFAISKHVVLFTIIRCCYQNLLKYLLAIKFLIIENNPYIIHYSSFPVVDNNNEYGDRSQQAPTANKSPINHFIILGSEFN